MRWSGKTVRGNILLIGYSVCFISFEMMVRVWWYVVLFLLPYSRVVSLIALYKYINIEAVCIVYMYIIHSTTTLPTVNGIITRIIITYSVFITFFFTLCLKCRCHRSCRWRWRCIRLLLVWFVVCVKFVLIEAADVTNSSQFSYVFGRISVVTVFYAHEILCFIAFIRRLMVSSRCWALIRAFVYARSN